MGKKIPKIHWMNIAHIALYAACVAIIILAKLRISTSDGASWGFIVDASLPYLIALALVAIFYKPLKISFRGGGDPKRGFSPNYSIMGVLLVLGAQMMMVPVLWIFKDVDWWAHTDNILLSNQSGIAPMLVGMVIYPVMMELFFRRIILGNLEPRIGLWWALILSSLMEGASAIVPWDMLTGFSTAMVYGAIYVRCRSISTVVFIHMLVDGIGYLLFLFLGSESYVRNQIQGELSFSVLLWAASVIAFILLLSGLSENKTTNRTTGKGLVRDKS